MQPKQEPPSQGLSWALGITGALVLVSIQQEPSGLLLGALLGYLFAQVLHLRGWVRDLHRELHRSREPGKGTQESQLTPELSPYHAVTRPLAPEPVPAPQESSVAPVAALEVPAGIAPSVPLEKPAQQPSSARSMAAKPSPFEQFAESALAWIKGGNPLARAGIVILFFGAAFLAKYAADNSLFPIELRFLALALGAFALLFVGWRLRDTRTVYAQLLQGGGIAGLYLTVFAALKLYELLPAGLAFILMVAIVLAAAALAVAQNALSLAVIGAAGGFLAPIFVSTGGGDHIALFAYYAVLNVGIFAIAWFRTWRVLNVLGFVFTFGITALWRASDYESADLVSADAFLILFFLMYVAVSVLNCVRQPPDLKGYVSGSLVFGLPMIAFALHASLISRIEYGLAWSALALGAFYLLLGWTLLRAGRESFRLLIEAFAALGAIFASLAIPLAFDAQTTAAMWAVEGAGLIWLGLRQRRKLARAFGTLLQFGAGIAFLGAIDALQPHRLIFNGAYLGTLMLSVSALVSSFWLHRDRDRLAVYEEGSALVFALWGTAWWLGGGIYQIVEFLDAAVLGSALIYASSTAAVLTLIGHRRDWRPGLTIAWWLPVLTAVVALAYTNRVSHMFAEFGAAGWLAWFAVQYGLLYAADVHAPYAAPAKSLLHAGACWLLALLVASEASWQLAIHVGGTWSALPWGLAPAFALAIVSVRKPRPAWPIARHLHAYRFTAAVPLAIAVCVWIFGVNLTNRGDPVWLPYLPLFNPLDVSVALCIVSLVAWWLAIDDKQRAQFESVDSRAVYAVMTLLTFLWLNAALIRALHYTVDTPLTLFGIARSTLVQASLSIFWGVLGFAAMTFSARARLRVVWILGAVLMSIVVLKLFLVDLSNTGTVARIASFLSVGVLLLVTGYLAPLPPRRSNDSVASAA